MAKGISAMGTFFAELVPPDFSYTRSWIIPVFDTLAISVGGNPRTGSFIFIASGSSCDS